MPRAALHEEAKLYKEARGMETFARDVKNSSPQKDAVPC